MMQFTLRFLDEHSTVCRRVDLQCVNAEEAFSRAVSLRGGQVMEPWHGTSRLWRMAPRIPSLHMKSGTRRGSGASFAIVAGLLAALTAAGAWGDPPPGKGKGHGRSDSGSAAVEVRFTFTEHDRIAVRDYYGGAFGGGHCPPGLAKKNNGCMPPGQAKKWALGRPLPRDVVFYDLPESLRVRLSLPPAGHRYVRVAGDILLIAAGTGMVAAAIEDLARN